MPHSTFLYYRSTVTVQPQAQRCMQKLHLTEEDILTIMNEWESSNVIATDPITTNILAAYPDTAQEIPAFYEAERTFLERNIVYTVYYSTSIKERKGKKVLYASVHWLSSHEPLPEIYPSDDAEIEPPDWLEPKKYSIS